MHELIPVWCGCGGSSGEFKYYLYVVSAQHTYHTTLEHTIYTYEHTYAGNSSRRLHTDHANLQGLLLYTRHGYLHMDR